ncbi:hypothetical protein E3N88_31138 [Mikania micrantha]|uniref:Uncharacterized protein n=1 Tax=Mikania micrantha TaxID=192012 RepID=A0A5N6MRI6_9ASTR|nr:hypothetical protein E3N88_31138 [Mikania micrantha]
MNPKMISSHEYSSNRCFRIVRTMLELFSYDKDLGNKLDMVDIIQLGMSCDAMYEKENGDRYSEPMAWIGIYIAIASLLCTLAMAADLLHGFRSKKLWFPCKYFSLNAASISVIAIAMKLPVDLTSPMPSYMDQKTKLGSLAFMCTMMANFLPSLASMDDKTLLANVTGFAILTITVIVNICIQIYTCVIDGNSYVSVRLSTPSISSKTNDIDEDLGNYVLRIDNDMELAGKTLKSISNCMNSFILKAVKEENNKLLELLDKSTGFKGVEIFDSDHVQSMLSVELVNSVSYAHLVDESLNHSNEYASFRNASMSLWNEVENKCKLLGNPLAKDDFIGKTSIEILKWFSDKAKEIVTEINQSTDGELMENPPENVIEKREASVRVAANLLGKTTKIIERLETLEVPSMDDDKKADIDQWRLYMKQYVP